MHPVHLHLAPVSEDDTSPVARKKNSNNKMLLKTTDRRGTYVAEQLVLYWLTVVVTDSSPSGDH